MFSVERIEMLNEEGVGLALRAGQSGVDAALCRAHSKRASDANRQVPGAAVRSGRL